MIGARVQPEIYVADDVPGTFADLVTELAPTTFALSGGSTARRCYEELGRRGHSWADTTFLVSDERWVPVDHPDSNEGQARRAWLDHVEVGGLSSMRGDASDISSAAAAYEAVIARVSPIEVCHLGLGDDGHVASLFPGSPALDVTDRLVVHTGDDLHEWPRLTFTYPAISACRTVVITATGAGKREAFERVRDGDRSMPATAVRAAERLVYVVDSEVAPTG